METGKLEAIALEEPFLVADPNFNREALANEAQTAEWYRSSIMEQFEKLKAYSSFFIQEPAKVRESLARLDYLHTHSFGTVHAARRRQLMRALHGYPTCLESQDILRIESKYNRNAHIWRKWPTKGH
mgnify:FL=1